MKNFSIASILFVAPLFVASFMAMPWAHATTTVDLSAPITAPRDPGAPPANPAAAYGTPSTNGGPLPPPLLPEPNYPDQTIATKDDFLHSNQDNWNLRFYPLDLILGGMRVDLLTHGDSSWAIGPTIEKLGWNLGFLNTSSWGAGVTSTYSFGRPAFSHGWYLSPEVVYNSGSVGVTDDMGDSASVDYTEYTAALTAGYHWYWKSFNLALGLGAEWETYSISNVHATSVNVGGGSTTTNGTGGTVGMSLLGLTADFIMGVTF